MVLKKSLFASKMIFSLKYSEGLAGKMTFLAAKITFLSGKVNFWHQRLFFSAWNISRFGNKYCFLRKKYSCLAANIFMLPTRNLYLAAINLHQVANNLFIAVNILLRSDKVRCVVMANPCGKKWYIYKIPINKHYW